MTHALEWRRRPVPLVTVAGADHPLDKHSVAILRRWLDVRAGIIKALEGSDPGYLWIPTEPGRERVGVQPPKPGLTRAAVRTLHACPAGDRGAPAPVRAPPPPMTRLPSRP
ncbi:hypothetical protein [Streptomyces sp. H72]